MLISHYKGWAMVSHELVHLRCDEWLDFTDGDIVLGGGSYKTQWNHYALRSCLLWPSLWPPALQTWDHVLPSHICFVEGSTCQRQWCQKIISLLCAFTYLHHLSHIRHSHQFHVGLRKGSMAGSLAEDLWMPGSLSQRVEHLCCERMSSHEKIYSHSKQMNKIKIK